MPKKHQAIYVPGLADVKFGKYQESAIRLWRHWDIEPHYFPMDWSEGKFDAKLDRLTAKIIELSQKGPVSLGGSSAGGSAVINAYAENKNLIDSVIMNCAKIQHPETIEDWHFEMNPAFRESMEMLPSSLEKLSPNDRRRILSRFPLFDRVVPPEDAVVEGAYNERMYMAGHFLSISYGITLGFGRVARFIEWYKD